METVKNLLQRVLAEARRQKERKNKLENTVMVDYGARLRQMDKDKVVAFVANNNMVTSSDKIVESSFNHKPWEDSIENAKRIIEKEFGENYPALLIIQKSSTVRSILDIGREKPTTEITTGDFIKEVSKEYPGMQIIIDSADQFISNKEYD